MCKKSGMALVVLGAILILAPVVSRGVAAVHDKERIASFYERNPNGAILPPGLQPSEYAGYDWACLGIGAGMAFFGIIRPIAEASSKQKGQPFGEV